MPPLTSSGAEFVIVCGTVSGGTSPTFTGVGFTGVRNTTGKYTITFSPSLPMAPFVVVSARATASSVGNHATAYTSSLGGGADPSASSFQVWCTDASSSGFQDTGFDFIAIVRDP